MKKHLGKILTFTLVLAISISCVVAFTACGGDPEIKYDLKDAIDYIQEDFGIAVKKGDAATLAEVNKVVDAWNTDGTMTKYLDYYTALNKHQLDESNPAPEANGLKLSWNLTGTDNLIMYTEAGFAPYEWEENGQIIGLDVAIASQVAENMGKNLKIENVKFPMIPTEVQKSTTPAIGAAGLTITDERKQSLDFSNIYSSSTLVVVSKTGINSLAGLEGKKVGVQTGTSGDLICEAVDSEEGCTYNDGDKDVTVKADIKLIVKLDTYAMLKLQLKNDQIDAIVMDKIPAQALFAGETK